MMRMQAARGFWIVFVALAAASLSAWPPAEAAGRDDPRPGRCRTRIRAAGRTWSTGSKSPPTRKRRKVPSRSRKTWPSGPRSCFSSCCWSCGSSPGGRSSPDSTSASADRREIAQAKRANEEAKRLLAQYEEKLARSEDEVRGILDQAKRDAQKISQQIVDKAHRRPRTTSSERLRRSSVATNSALKELAERSAALAVDLAGQIVKRNLDSDADARLIQEAVAGFDKSRGER